MIKKILRTIWIIFLEVVSIPLDLITFVCVFIQAISMKKQYGVTIGEHMKLFLANIKQHYILRINWIKGDNSIWKF